VILCFSEPNTVQVIGAACIYVVAVSFYKSMTIERLTPRAILEEFDEATSRIGPGELRLEEGAFAAGAALVHDILKDQQMSFQVYAGEREEIQQRLRRVGHVLAPPVDPAHGPARRIHLFEGATHTSDTQKPVLWAQLNRQPDHPANAPMYGSLQVTLRPRSNRVIDLFHGAPRKSSRWPQGINIWKPIVRAEAPVLFDALRVVKSIVAVLPRDTR
jgi:hypothetical protein